LFFTYWNIQTIARRALVGLAFGPSDES